MRYVKARYAEYKQSLAYRIYITDSLYYYGNNQRLTKRYIDIVMPEPVDPRSGDEIALDVISRLDLKVEK